MEFFLGTSSSVMAIIGEWSRLRDKLGRSTNHVVEEKDDDEHSDNDHL